MDVSSCKGIICSMYLLRKGSKGEMIKKFLQIITVEKLLQLCLFGCYLVELAFYIESTEMLDKIALGTNMNNTLLGLIFVTLVGGKKHD